MANKYDFIVDIGRNSPRPLAAFMVGREQKRARERQVQIDELEAESQGVLNDYRRTQSDEVRNAPAREAAAQAQAAAQARQEQTEMAKAIYDNPDIPANLKGQIIPMIMSGNEKGIQEGLDLAQDYLKPNRIQRTQEVPYNASALNTSAIESAQMSASLRRNLVATIPDVIANKGSVGIRGGLGQGIGGLVTAATGSSQAGDAASEFISGASQEDIAKMQTRVQQVRSHIIPILAKENSSRVSDQEREIASRASGTLDEIKGPADFAKSWPKVVGSMKELVLASLENEFEQALSSDAVEFPFDLNTPSGRSAAMDVFEAAQYDDADTIRALERLMSIQNANQ